MLLLSQLGSIKHSISAFCWWNWGKHGIFR